MDESERRACCSHRADCTWYSSRKEMTSSTSFFKTAQPTSLVTTRTWLSCARLWSMSRKDRHHHCKTNLFPPTSPSSHRLLFVPLRRHSHCAQQKELNTTSHYHIYQTRQQNTMVRWNILLAALLAASCSAFAPSLSKSVGRRRNDEILTILVESSVGSFVVGRRCGRGTVLTT